MLLSGFVLIKGRGRILQEITFNDLGVKEIGPFRACDYFGDGSLYLLDTPGHAVGHLSALVRTTSNPETFIFLGGDLWHHNGELRPSKDLRIPQSIMIPPQPSLSCCSGSTFSCPGSMLESLQVKRGRRADEPFFDPVMGLDVAEVSRSLRKAQAMDCNENILFISAHEYAILGVVDLFPESANDWKRKGWREKILWTFLKDFERSEQFKN